MSNWFKEKSENFIKPKRKSIEEIHEEYFNSEDYVIPSTIFHNKNVNKITTNK